MQVKPLSLPVHDLLDIVTGLILMLAPTALHLSTSAQIASVLLGATLTGAGLGLTALRSTSAVAHTRFDIAFLLATALAALTLALAGQFRAVLLVSAAVTLQALLGFNTRYRSDTPYRTADPSAPSKRGHEQVEGEHGPRLRSSRVAGAPANATAPRSAPGCEGRAGVFPSYPLGTPLRPPTTASTRSAIRSPVKPTSSWSSAGEPCVM